MALAGVLAALRITGARLEDQKVVILGAGSAAVGIGRALAGAAIWMLDSKGLVTVNRASPDQRQFARDEPPGNLLDVAQRVRPTVLDRHFGARGVFTREVIEAMSGDRPLVFPLSNPTSQSECTPEQARAWSGGRAIVATGSPFPDTAQCNNMYIFPAVGLGVLASGARRVTDEMFRVAATTLAGMAEGEALFPPLRENPHVRAAAGPHGGKVRHRRGGRRASLRRHAARTHRRRGLNSAVPPVPRGVKA